MNDEIKGNCKPGNLHLCVQEDAKYAYSEYAEFNMEKQVPFDITFLMSQQVWPCRTERKAKLPFTFLSPYSHPAKTQMKIQACQLVLVGEIF